MAPSRAFVQAFSQLIVRSAPPLAVQSHLQPGRLPTAPLARTLTTLPHRSTIRTFSTESTSGPEAPDYLSESELRIFNKLKVELNPTKLEVQDISGGCGSMYGIDIVSPKFTGIPVIKQHRLVNQVLGEEIKNWHGIQLKTGAA